MIRYQNDERRVPKIFLSDLLQIGNEEEEKNKPRYIDVAGIIVKINKLSDIICSFNIEDFTLSHLTEVFRDKLPSNFTFQLGDIIELKGQFTVNKYKERVIRVFKARKITFKELLIYQLETINEKMIRNEMVMSEEAVIARECKMAEEKKVDIIQSNENIQKKIISSIFLYLLKNVHKLRENGGYMDNTNFINIPEIQTIRQKVINIDMFDDLFHQSLCEMEQAQLLKKVNEDLFINIDFFDNFESDLLDLLENTKKSEISFRDIFIIVNDMIVNNVNNFITRDTINEIIGKLTFGRKLMCLNNKKELFTLI